MTGQPAESRAARFALAIVGLFALAVYARTLLPGMACAAASQHLSAIRAPCCHAAHQVSVTKTSKDLIPSSGV